MQLNLSHFIFSLEYRPDWKKFIRGPKESAKGYEARLRQSFSFTQSEVLPGVGPASQEPAKQPSKQEGKSSKVRSSALEAFGVNPKKYLVKSERML